jgi:hypothetical protein
MEGLARAAGASRRVLGVVMTPERELVGDCRVQVHATSFPRVAAKRERFRLS